MKVTTILAALVSTMLLIPGCGDPAIGKLQTITLTSAGTGGLFEVKGEGGILQLRAVGIYTTKTQVDLTNKVTYSLIVTPQTPPGTDVNGNPLAPPPATLQISSTGLLTAVQPFVCTFMNTGTSTTPAYALTGSYQVTATFSGVTSQPVFIGVASAVGDGPSGACGP